MNKIKIFIRIYVIKSYKIIEYIFTKLNCTWNVHHRCEVISLLNVCVLHSYFIFVYIVARKPRFDFEEPCSVF